MTVFRSNLSANFQNLRSLMPVVSEYAYFDHAAVSPLPSPARDAIQNWLNEAASSGDAQWMRWHQEAESARMACADLLSADPSEMCMVPSTTYGINIVANGLPWRSGDSVVIPENEFPSNWLAWKLLANRGVDVRTVSPLDTGEVSIDHLLSHADHTTRLISVSWVGYLSGYRIDLHQLIERAHSRNIQVFVDAIQGLGAFPLNAEELQIDYLAADGHKWMLGPEGAGLFYIAKRNLDRIAPQMIGWNSVTNAGQFNHGNVQLKDSASRFEGGTTNMVGVLGFGAAVRTLLDCGSKDPASGFASNIIEVSKYAADRLKALGAIVYREYSPENYSGIISFTLPGKDATFLRTACISRNVILSVRHGRMRIAVHAYNNEADVDKLIDALQSVS